MNRTTTLLVTSLALAASAGRPVIKIWAGEENAFFLREDSTVYGIGRNDWSQLGRIHTEGVKSRNSGLNRFGKMFQDPEFPIGPNLYGAVSIVPAPTFTLAVLNDHTVWATGENSWGQHANGIIQPSPAFTQVLDGIDSLAAGDQHALYLGSDGVLKAAGRNHKGQLGLTADGLRRSALITVASGVRSVWAVGNTSFFVKTDGSVWAMGENVSGLIPGSTAPVVVTPVRIPGIPSRVVGIRASRKHAVALLTDGTVWGWGSDENGALSGTANLVNRSPELIAQEIQEINALTWGTVLVNRDLWIVGISAAGRKDIATQSNVVISLYGLRINQVASSSEAPDGLRSFFCGEQSCYWQSVNPIKTVYNPVNPALGLWVTDGTQLDGGRGYSSRPYQRRLGTGFSYGGNLGIGIEYTAALSIPGEKTSIYSLQSQSILLQEIEYQEAPGYYQQSQEPGGSAYVIRSLTDLLPGGGAQALSTQNPSTIYVYDATAQGCRQDEQGYNFCRNPIQSALDLPKTQNQEYRAVQIVVDPDDGAVTDVSITQPTILMSRVRGVWLNMNSIVMGPHIFYGLNLTSLKLGGGLLDLDRVTLLRDTIELPFGKISGNVFGSYLRSRVNQGGPGFGMIDGAQIVDSKFDRWSGHDIGGFPVSPTIQNARFSNVIFTSGVRFADIVGGSSRIDQCTFYKVGLGAYNISAIYDFAYKFENVRIANSWIGRRHSGSTQLGWIERVASTEVSGVVLSGTPVFASWLDSRVLLDRLTMSGGVTRDDGSDLFSGSLGVHSEISLQKVVVANHSFGGKNLLSPGDPGDVNEALIFGVQYGGDQGALFGRQDRTSIKNSYFMWNTPKYVGTADYPPFEWSGQMEQVLIDGESDIQGSCQINAQMTGWKNNTFLASPCRGVAYLNSSSQAVGIFNTLGFGIGGGLRSSNSILFESSNSDQINSLITSPAGPDGLRETWWDNDYSPKAGGPLVDQGNSSVTLPRSTDLAGYPRVSGAAIDIGAYELTDLATYTLQIQPSEGGQTLPAEFAIAMPENGHKVQVVASPFHMWNFERWEFDPLDVSVENPLSPTTMVTLTKNASIKPIFRKTQTFDDIVLKYVDPSLDDWNPSCEFSGAPHWDFIHGSAFHFGDKRMQMVLEAAPFQAQLATDGGVRVYLDVLEQPGMNVYDYRFKIRAKRGGGWFVTRERWDVSGPKPKWKFDGDSRVDATVGAVAPNTTLQTSLDGPFTKGSYVQAGGLFEIAMGLPQSVAKSNVGLWIEGAGDRFVTAATPLSYTWEGPGASFTIDGNLQDWLAPVPGADP